MKEELISFKTAKLAKEKGINIEKLLPNINKNWFTKSGKLNGYTPKEPYYICTQSLLQKWLREVHGIYVYSYIGSYPSDIHKGYSDYLIQRKGFEDIRSGMTNTYEEALEEGLQEALKLINL